MKKDRDMKKIVLGLVVIVVVSFMIGGTIFKVSGGIDNMIHLGDGEVIDFNEIEKFDLENIKNINVDTTSNDIRFIATDEENIKVHYYGKVSGIKENEVPKLVAEKFGDNINVEIEYPNKMQISLGIHVEQMILDIYIPKKYKENIFVENTSGDVKLENLNLKNFDAKITSGNIESEFFTSEEAIIENTSGKVKMTDYVGNLKIKGSSGDVDISFKTLDGDIDIERSSGDVKLELPSDAQFYLKANTTSGDINSNFPISINGKIEENKIEGTIGSGTNKIDIDVTSGDIILKSRTK